MNLLRNILVLYCFLAPDFACAQIGKVVRLRVLRTPRASFDLAAQLDFANEIFCQADIQFTLEEDKVVLHGEFDVADRNKLTQSYISEIRKSGQQYVTVFISDGLLPKPTAFGFTVPLQAISTGRVAGVGIFIGPQIDRPLDLLAHELGHALLAHVPILQDGAPAGGDPSDRLVSHHQSNRSNVMAAADEPPKRPDVAKQRVRLRSLTDLYEFNVGQLTNPQIDAMVQSPFALDVGKRNSVITVHKIESASPGSFWRLLAVGSARGLHVKTPWIAPPGDVVKLFDRPDGRAEARIPVPWQLIPNQTYEAELCDCRRKILHRLSASVGPLYRGMGAARNYPGGRVLDSPLSFDSFAITDARLDDGRFTAPVSKSCVVSGFGTRNFLVGKPIVPIHQGLDLKAPIGTTVSAFAKGRVEAIASGISAGGVLLLNHGQGLMSYYSHLETVTVAKGQAVDAGQSIGSTASTFLPWGPHLHWGVLLSGIPINPRRFVAINYCSVPP